MSKRRWVMPAFLFATVLITQVLYTMVRHHAAIVTESIVDQGPSEGEIQRSEFVKARAIRMIDTYPLSDSNAIVHMIEAEILGGTFRGQRVVMRNQVRAGGFPLLSIRVRPGDVFVARVGGVGGTIGSVALVQEYNRDGILVLLAGLVAFLIILVGRWEGIRTILALALSGGTIYFIMLPLLHQGKDPLIVTTIVCAAIAAISLLIIAGPHRKSVAAILGTVGGVVIAAIIVLYAQSHLHLRGTENYTAAEIIEAGVAVHLDFRRLLLAGMLLGLLGAAMDGAIDVASSMEEVRRVNPNVTRRYLIRAGMNVGTDVIGTMSNTLIYAYIGFRLLLIMAALGTDLFSFTHMQLLSISVISAEVVRALAGSIGLIISVPLTIFIFAFWVGKPNETQSEAEAEV